MALTNFWDRYTKPFIFIRLIIILLVFLQFYPTKFQFLPVTLRVIVSGMGMGLILFQYIYRIALGRRLYVKKQFLYILAPLALMTILSAFTLNYNGTEDPMYLYYFITSFLMLSSGYFTISIMNWAYKGNLTYDIIVYYCLLAVLIQLVFGIISFVDRPLILPLLLKTEEGVLQLKSTEAGRFIGFGQYFMNLGVANGFVLLLTAPILKFSSDYGISKRMKFWIVFCYIIIAILGNMQARTTGVCFIFSLLYLSFSDLRLNLKSLKSGIGQIITVILLIAMLVAFVVLYFGDELSKYQRAWDYGFELFESVNKGKGANTTSSNILKRMLTIWPKTTKTWMIGDGQYFTEGKNYYMSTDVGYARLLFYFGIFGMVIYFIYQIIIAYFSFRDISKQWKALLTYIIIMLFVINIKSCYDFVYYYSLFFSFNIIRQKTIDNKNYRII